jgi:hypothetical protein
MRERLGISAILLFLLSGLAAGQDKPAVVIRAEPGFPRRIPLWLARSRWQAECRARR